MKNMFIIFKINLVYLFICADINAFPDRNLIKSMINGITADAKTTEVKQDQLVLPRPPDVEGKPVARMGRTPAEATVPTQTACW